MGRFSPRIDYTRVLSEQVGVMVKQLDRLVKTIDESSKRMEGLALFQRQPEHSNPNPPREIKASTITLDQFNAAWDKAFATDSSTVNRYAIMLKELGL